jgi:hypothetical protein
MLEDFRTLPSKFKIILGLGVSGLLFLIGNGIGNYTILQHQWRYIEGEIFTYDTGYEITKVYGWEYGGLKTIYPLQNIGIIVSIIGIGIFIGSLVYINYLQLSKLRIKVKFNIRRSKERT